MNSTSPDLSPGYVAVSTDLSGKKIGNYAIQQYIDNQDGLGPVLQTIYLQNVIVTPTDENGHVLQADDRIDDYEWKRQVLDELRAIRIGTEARLETGRTPSIDVSRTSLIEEAIAARADFVEKPLEQEL